jgi:iron complex outermembrane receptor protein
MSCYFIPLSCALNIRTGSIAGLLALWGLAGPLRAQEVSPDPVVAPAVLKRMSVEELLAQPVISVSRRAEAWSQAPSNVFLIRNQAVASTGATVLPDLLRMSTNFFVAQKSASEWAVNARGFVRTNSASNKLLVTIDGRTVYSPLFSNVFWESTSMFLPDLDRIEVISGPAGSTWGANAVNGVISIQSKSARDTLGGLLIANTGTEENGFAARYGTKLGNNGAIRFYVQDAEHEATLSATGAKDDYDAWRSFQAGMRADWGTADLGEFTLQSDVFQGTYRDNPRLSNDTFSILGRWARNFTPDSQLWIRAYHDYVQGASDNVNYEVSHTTDVEFQHHVKLTEKQDFIWGANYRLLEDTIHNTVGYTILPADLNFTLGSIFAQHVIDLRDTLKLTTGIRAEHNYYSGWEYLPSIRLAQKLPGQLLWVAASRSARIPSRFDVDYYAPATAPYYIVQGGPDFKAEIVHAFELGWRGQPAKAVSLTATAYYNEYNDLRSIEPSGPAILPVTIGNGVAGRSYGLEVFADWDVTSWWRLRAGGFVMHQETWLKAGGGDLEQGLGEGSFPEYQAQLRNTFHLGRAVTWWTSLRHVAEVPAYDGGNGVVPAYTELDMSLNWRARQSLEFVVTGRNLLDASHPEIGGLTARREIQRSVQASVRLKF